MTRQDILKDAEFEEVIEAKVDAKHRVALGRLSGGHVSSYRVYRNRVGQIILDPLVSVPAHEAWLFKNPEAKRRLQAGLADAKQGRLTKAKEDYTKYLDEPA